MKIAVSVMYYEPELRRLYIAVDDKPWYQEFLYVRSGLNRNLVIEEHSLSVVIDPEPLRETSHE